MPAEATGAVERQSFFQNHFFDMTEQGFLPLRHFSSERYTTKKLMKNFINLFAVIHLYVKLTGRDHIIRGVFSYTEP